MNPDDPASLFRNPEEYVSFAEGLAPYYQMYEAPLKILVWGPGETAQKQWWEKRATLIDFLSVANPQDEVETSEDLFKKYGAAPIDPGHFEIHHAEEADIILALVLASPKSQGGVYRELEIIADYESLRQKTHIFLPEGDGAKAYLERFQAGQLYAYEESQKYFYSWSDINTCERIRGKSRDIVEEQRKQRMYRKRQAHLKTID